MVRKKKSSPAEDLMEIIAVFPWWVSVALAVLFYAVLHAYVSAPASLVKVAPGTVGLLAVVTLFQTAAGILQYLLPFICLIGAAVSAIRRSQREQLLQGVSKGVGTAALHAMTWQQFEQVIGQYFRHQGFAVIEHGGSGADGGIDLVLKKEGETFLVQCKQWRATKVGVTVVRELFGVMAAHGATGGFVVSSGAFTVDAREFASGRNVTLLDGEQLARIIQATVPADTVLSPLQARPVSHYVDRTIPHCPECGAAMVGRVAKRGATPGQRFWGCANYPACKGTLPG